MAKVNRGAATGNDTGGCWSSATRTGSFDVVGVCFFGSEAFGQAKAQIEITLPATRLQPAHWCGPLVKPTCRPPERRKTSRKQRNVELFAA